VPPALAADMVSIRLTMVHNDGGVSGTNHSCDENDESEASRSGSVWERILASEGQ
jgi:hypothetical protein